jgi:hypothetical protein
MKTNTVGRSGGVPCVCGVIRCASMMFMKENEGKNRAAIRKKLRLNLTNLNVR